MNIKKFVLVTASHLPQHKYFLDVAKKLANELGVELEVREEDYEFLSQYGEKDEFGMAWAPQLFVVLENNDVKPILTKLPIDEKTLKIDTARAYELAKQALSSLS